ERGGRSRIRRGSCVRGCRPRQAQALARARGGDEAGEQRMPIPRRRRELRMELRGEEPRVVRQLDHLDEPVDGESGEHEAGLLEALEIAIVELVAMAVTLIDHVPAVDAPHEARALQLA